MIELVMIVFGVLLAVAIMARFLGTYVRGYQSTPFLMPTSSQGGTLPFGVVQVQRLAEHMQESEE